MKRVFATLRALVEVMESLSKDVPSDGVGRLIMDELRRIKKSDATKKGKRVFSSFMDLFDHNVSGFNNGKINLNTFKTFLSIGPKFAVMNFFESCLDVVLMFGAYTSARGMAISRLVIRFFWCGFSSVFVLYMYCECILLVFFVGFLLLPILATHITMLIFRKLLEERNRNTSDSLYFRIYVLVLGVYAGLRILFALLLKLPSCHRLSEMSDQSFFQIFKWIYQERYFVGRGLVEKTTDYLSSQKRSIIRKKLMRCVPSWQKAYKIIFMSR